MATQNPQGLSPHFYQDGDLDPTVFRAALLLSACAVCGSLVPEQSAVVPKENEWLKRAYFLPPSLKCFRQDHHHPSPQSKQDFRTVRQKSPSQPDQISQQALQTAQQNLNSQPSQNSQLAQASPNQWLESNGDSIVFQLGDWATGENGVHLPTFQLLSHRSYPVPLHAHCMAVAHQMHHHECQILNKRCGGQYISPRVLECLYDRFATSLFTKVNWARDWGPRNIRIIMDPHLLDPHHYLGALDSQKHEPFVIQGIQVPMLFPSSERRSHFLKMIDGLNSNKIPKHFTSDPLRVTGVTDFLILKLNKNAAPAPTEQATKLRQQLYDLPPEVFAQVIAHLKQSFNDPPLNCTRILPGTWWRDALFVQPQIIPWLRGLFSTQLRDKKYSKCDWELLLRELAQKNAFENTNLGVSAPNALRNRRRIWRLLEEMEVGDAREMPVVQVAYERWTERVDIFRRLEKAAEEAGGV